MSQAPKKKVKKVVKTTSAKKVVKATGDTKRKLKPTTSKAKRSAAPVAHNMLFNRENYKWVFIGIAFIVLGMFLMVGGSMPSPDVWDDSIIYSHRRITVAPLMILIGLGIQVYAIFK